MSSIITEANNDVFPDSQISTVFPQKWMVEFLIKGEYLVKNTTDIRIDVIFYD